jgi:alkylation response protein AidB-like acyl-CoA dehydrogenase
MEALDSAAEAVFRAEVRKWLAENTAGFAGSVQARPHFFLVDLRTPGIEVRPLRQMNGSYHFNEVFLDGVRIPSTGVVGEVNAGWEVVPTTDLEGRPALPWAPSQADGAQASMMSWTRRSRCWSGSPKSSWVPLARLK